MAIIDDEDVPERRVVNYVDTCSVVIGDWKCDRVVHQKSLQLCNAHNLQRHRGLEFSVPRRRQGVADYKSQPCAVDGCEAPKVSRGLCDNHYFYALHELSPPPLYRKRRQKGAALDRDEQQRKECIRCSEWKPEDAFGFSSNTLDNLRGECKQCRSLVARVRNNPNPSDHPSPASLRRHNLSEESYSALFSSQGGRCGICGTKTPTLKGWQVDHNHSCCESSSCGDCVRGILCSLCNTALGLFNDNPSAMESAAAYIRRHND